MKLRKPRVTRTLDERLAEMRARVEKRKLAEFSECYACERRSAKPIGDVPKTPNGRREMRCRDRLCGHVFWTDPPALVNSYRLSWRDPDAKNRFRMDPNIYRVYREEMHRRKILAASLSRRSSRSLRTYHLDHRVSPSEHLLTAR